MNLMLHGVTLILALSLLLGLLRSLLGPSLADRLLGIQLLGSGGVALCIVFTIKLPSSYLDVALILAMLATASAVALVTTSKGQRSLPEKSPVTPAVSLAVNSVESRRQERAHD